MMHRLIRRAVTSWILWQAQRRLRNAVPALAALDAERAEIASRHKAGSRAIDMRKRRLVTERLRTELGRA